jgi:hypothetical protein
MGYGTVAFRGEVVTDKQLMRQQADLGPMSWLGLVAPDFSGASAVEFVGFDRGQEFVEVDG